MNFDSRQDATQAEQGPAFPSGGEYCAALQNTDLCFRRLDLQRARPLLNAIGIPRPISGSAAAVFSLTCSDGRRVAVKCFTRHALDQESRYQKISEHLAQVQVETLSQPWKVSFEYLTDGILVEGARYPIVVMDWVDGIQLSQWLNMHHQNQTAVMDLAHKFAELITDLRKQNIAHGDLQHGNLLVAPDHTFRLVDYDGLYVPTLEGQSGREVGHRNYQSPRRKLRDFGPAMDNFSAWVIYTSLVSVAADPNLWSGLHDEDGEYLLLTADDFADPASSERFPGLLRHPNPEVSSSMRQLEVLCGKPLDDVPALDSSWLPVREGDPSVLRGDAGTEDASSAQAGNPDWLSSHLSNPAAPSSLAVPSFQGRRIQEFLLSGLGILTVGVPLCMHGLGHLNPYLTVVGFLLTALLFVSFSSIARSTRSEVRGLHNSHKSLDQLLALASEAAVHYAVAQEEAARLAKEDSDKVEEVANKNRELTHHLQASYAGIEFERNAATERLRGDIASLKSERDEALQERLIPLQQPWVQEKLLSFKLSKARLRGITSKDISMLSKSKIRTAADVGGVKRIKSGADAVIIVADGTLVKVSGIGPRKADTLYTWRQNCENEARASCPVTLPAAQIADVEASFL